MLYSIKNRRINKKALLFFASLFLIDALIIGNWFGLEELVQRLEGTELATEVRLELNIAALPMLQDFFWVGSGINSFGQLLPAYTLSQAGVPFEHAHNDYVELFTSLGIIGSVFLLAALWQVLRASWQQSKPAYAVIMLMLYTAGHSFTDFNLYIPAFAFTLCACLATAYCPQNNKRKTTRKSQG
jgi:O-antigen ligase